MKKTVKTIFLNGSDAYELLRNTIEDFPGKAVVIQGSNNNVQVSYYNMIKSIVMHCLIPWDYLDRSLETVKNVFL